MKIYKVGGAVRDELLGLPVSEIDYVVVGALPEQLLADGYTQVGRDFPVFLHPQSKAEYALARVERKSAPGYHGFVCRADPSVTLEEDLSRRDFTINAMARAEDGSLIDPYGGARDLAARRLRHVSPAFAEDPVRILRGARFAARYAPFGFAIAAETLELMRQMVAAGEADHLVPERVWKEWQRALTEPAPQVFLAVLEQVGALARVAPELQPPSSSSDTGQSGPQQLLAAAAALTPDPEVRFAATLLRLPTQGDNAPGPTAAERLCRRLGVPNSYRELALKATSQVDTGHRAFDLPAEPVLALIEALDGLRRPERFEQFLLCCQADAIARQPTLASELNYPQAAYLRRCMTACRGITAAPLLARGLRGPELGAALRQARLAAVQALNGQSADCSR